LASPSDRVSPEESCRTPIRSRFPWSARKQAFRITRRSGTPRRSPTG